MRKLLSIIVGLSLPLAVLALDYSDATGRYTDPSFTRSEAAAISVLTNAGVVSGNDDGSFLPRRTLNRAEFAKIAVLSAGIEVSVAGNCFPDVRNEWFARYVCTAKKRGIVQGNPDGLYHPERNVNYAEAVKILAGLYGYDVSMQLGDAWFAPFLRAADERGVLLPVALDPGALLTRGQMARLTAAVMAEAAGELDLYRAAENGETVASSSSSSSSSSSISSSSSSSSTSSSSSFSSTSTVLDLPVRSRFLVLGERTKPIAALTFFADKEAIFVRSVEIKLERKVLSFDTMYLVDENGVQIGQVSLDRLFDSTDKTWRASFSGGTYRIPKGTERQLAIEALLKERDKGGGSDELVKVEDFRMTAQGEDSGSNYNAIKPDSLVFPKHQTAQGRITSVVNALSETDSLPLGTNQVIGAFTFRGTHVSGAELRVENLEFQISKSSSVTVTNWQLGTGESSLRTPCTVNELIVSCYTIPAEIGTIPNEPRTLRLYGDVALEAGAQDYFLQVSLNQPGNPETIGAVQWTDGSGHFRWTELSSPVARSARFN